MNVHRIFLVLVPSILIFILTACAGESPATPDAVELTDTIQAPTLTALVVDDYQGFLSAVQAGDLELVRGYVEQGYDVNWIDPGGLSLLNYAANQGSQEVVALLLGSGAGVKYQDPWGMTSLHAALKEGHDDVAITLIEPKALVNLSTAAGYYPGYSALHVAVKFGRVSITTVEYLLEHGADVTLKTDRGSTALMLAQDAGWQQAEELLIEYGATE